MQTNPPVYPADLFKSNPPADISEQLGFTPLHLEKGSHRVELPYEISALNVSIDPVPESPTNKPKVSFGVEDEKVNAVVQSYDIMAPAEAVRYGGKNIAKKIEEPRQGVLHVTIVRGENLGKSATRPPQAPYVCARVGRTQRKTKYIRRKPGLGLGTTQHVAGDGDFIWEELIELAVENAQAQFLELKLMEHHTLHPDAQLGKAVTLALAPLAYWKTTEELKPDTGCGVVVVRLQLLPAEVAKLVKKRKKAKKQRIVARLQDVAHESDEDEGPKSDWFDEEDYLSDGTSPRVAYTASYRYMPASENGGAVAKAVYTPPPAAHPTGSSSWAQTSNTNPVSPWQGNPYQLYPQMLQPNPPNAPSQPISQGQSRQYSPLATTPVDTSPRAAGQLVYLAGPAAVQPQMWGLPGYSNSSSAYFYYR
eukprot:TRINITY_DN1824_c0_g1_i1.p1 TRINITY_DN1824_c0_g1~~TRINITY_DN1824_c0_g1_i1.p1  ORF type:complete len:421 (+),score=49.11 TRINITY_DN1824_c0_g1_i1:32-1294(+)